MPYVAAIVAGLFLLVMLAIFAIREWRENVKMRAQIHQLTNQISQAEQYHMALTDHIQEIHRMQHDSRHHLRVLSGYAQDGAYDRLEEYLSMLIEQSTSCGGISYCTNYTANILLNYYAEEAKDEGISFQCDAQIPAALACTPPHVCTVLGNALQNALDACAQQNPDERRYITLLARIVGESLVLEIKNSYDGVALEEDGRYLSRKGGTGHGLGLSSVQRVAEQYHGYCSIERTAHEFALKVVLQTGLQE